MRQETAWQQLRLEKVGIHETKKMNHKTQYEERAEEYRQTQTKRLASSSLCVFESP